VYMKLNSLTIDTLFEILNDLQQAIVLTNSKNNVIWFNLAIAKLFNLQEIKADSSNRDQIDTSAITHILNSGEDIEIVFNSQTLSFSHSQKEMLHGSDENLTIHYLHDQTKEKSLTQDLTVLRDQVMASQFRDPITGLLSERAFYLILEPQLARSRRYHNPLSIIAMQFHFAQDPDNIDRHAEHVRIASQQLKEVMRWADQLHYDSHGKFLIVLPETLANEVDPLIDKIDSKLICLPWLSSISYGITQWMETDSLGSLLKRANLALESSIQQNQKIFKL